MVQQRRPLASTAARKQQQETVPPGYAIDPNASHMLRFQASLPRLPVPTLASTLAKYVESVQPHLTPEELARTQAAVKAFGASDIGKQLQARLEARREEVVKNAETGSEEVRESWLSEWWNDVAYMGYRDPVVVFVSYFYVHLDLDYTRGVLGSGPAGKAAALLKATMKFRAMLESCVLIFFLPVHWK